MKRRLADEAVNISPVQPVRHSLLWGVLWQGHYFCTETALAKPWHALEAYRTIRNRNRNNLISKHDFCYQRVMSVD